MQYLNITLPVRRVHFRIYALSTQAVSMAWWVNEVILACDLGHEISDMI